MNPHDATEQAYRNGYHKGIVDGYNIATKEIIHCGECKYRTKETRTTRAGYCGRRVVGSFFKVSPDDFCSYGKRKED